MSYPQSYVLGSETFLISTITNGYVNWSWFIRHRISITIWYVVAYVRNPILKYPSQPCKIMHSSHQKRKETCEDHDMLKGAKIIHIDFWMLTRWVRNNFPNLHKICTEESLILLFYHLSQRNTSQEISCMELRLKRCSVPNENLKNKLFKDMTSRIFNFLIQSKIINARHPSFVNKEKKRTKENHQCLKSKAPIVWV